jgi:hypothetical protein
LTALFNKRKEKRQKVRDAKKVITGTLEVTLVSATDLKAADKNSMDGR